MHDETVDPAEGNLAQVIELGQHKEQAEGLALSEILMRRSLQEVAALSPEETAKRFAAEVDVVAGAVLITKHGEQALPIVRKRLVYVYGGILTNYYRQTDCTLDALREIPLDVARTTLRALRRERQDRARLERLATDAQRSQHDRQYLRDLDPSWPILPEHPWVRYLYGDDTGTRYLRFDWELQGPAGTGIVSLFGTALERELDQNYRRFRVEFAFCEPDDVRPAGVKGQLGYKPGFTLRRAAQIAQSKSERFVVGGRSLVNFLRQDLLQTWRAFVELMLMLLERKVLPRWVRTNLQSKHTWERRFREMPNRTTNQGQACKRGRVNVINVDSRDREIVVDALDRFVHGIATADDRETLNRMLGDLSPCKEEDR